MVSPSPILVAFSGGALPEKSEKKRANISAEIANKKKREGKFGTSNKS